MNRLIHYTSFILMGLTLTIWTESTVAQNCYQFTAPNHVNDYSKFYGLTILQAPADFQLAAELDVSWLSMQPVVIWLLIEKEIGEYDFSAIDSQIVNIQALGLDCTPVLLPLYATETQKAEIKAKIGDGDITAFLRSPESVEMKLYPDTPEELDWWQNFLRELVEHYDGDGEKDFDKLQYPIRYWHFVEEYPAIWIPDTYIYTALLKKTAQTIKATDPNAKVVLMGLAGNFARFFAYADGFITDDDAGIFNGVNYSRDAIKANPQMNS